jgi:putative transposase
VDDHRTILNKFCRRILERRSTVVDSTMVVGREWLGKQLERASPDLLREMVMTFIATLMGAEADAACGAGYGVVSEQRTNSRNGYRHRDMDTRLGTLDVAIPKLRQGSYFPDWLLTPRRRVEQALVSVVASCYFLGVSTRRVERLVETLGITRLSKSQVSEMAKSLDGQVAAFRNRPLDKAPYAYVWIDALTQRVREDGRIVNVSALVATGVNAEGHREILGLDVATGEDGASWLAFCRSLVARGLAGVQLVISDAHEGLKAAIGAALPGAAWQRCRTHYTANVLTKVPKSAAGLVGTLIRSIFDQPDAEHVHAQHALVVTELQRRLPAAAEHLAEAKEEILAFTAFPTEHWRQIRSNNPQERLNREIRRRSDVVGIFPDRDSIIRLLGAVLAEQHDEWAEARRYMSIESLAKTRLRLITNSGSDPAAAPALPGTEAVAVNA